MWTLARDGFEIVADGQLTGLERLCETLESPGVSRTRAGARHLLRVLEIAALADQPVLLDAARAAVGSGAVPFRATLFDKAPESNWLVAWHQDTALPLCVRHARPGWTSWSEKEGVLYAHAPASILEQIVAIRVHLDAATSENGPLRVLPGTHRCGVLDDEAIARKAREVTAFQCLVPRGGLLLMRPLVIHASSKIAAGQRRRVLHFEYAASLALGDGAALATA